MSKRKQVSNVIKFIAVSGMTSAQLKRLLAASEVINLETAGRFGMMLKRRTCKSISANKFGLTQTHAFAVVTQIPKFSNDAYALYAVSADADPTMLLLTHANQVHARFANSLRAIEDYENTDLKQRKEILANLYNQQLEQLGELRYLNANLSMDVADLIAAGEAACARYAELIKPVQAEIDLTWNNKW